MLCQRMILRHTLILLIACIGYLILDPADLYAESMYDGNLRQQGEKSSPTSVPTAITKSAIFLAKVKYNSNLRSGPGIRFTKIGSAGAGKTVRVIGTNLKGDWYQLEGGAWIAAFLVEDLSSKQPIVAVVATPLPEDIDKSLNVPSASTPYPTAAQSCLRPPDDMSRVKVNGETVNARTYWMLQLAQQIYGGPGSILRVVQGSYEPGLTESFGTHDGGGAVDISIRNPLKLEEILWDEAPKMVAAMRQAGFAAWYRPTGMFGPNSGAHIHAIAIGDPEMSQSARRQIDGIEGYFRGLDGVPSEYGGPNSDPHGGPVVCSWMVEMGFRDLR